MCKEQAKLEHGFSGANLRWGDERSSPELRRRRRENRVKEEKWTASSGSYSSARSAQTRHAECSPCQREAKGGRRRAWKTGERTPAVGRWRPVTNSIFKVFIDLPLRLFFKLLTNFLKKLKISKNESCSTFQTLQLCFKEHFQILHPFWNLNLGCIWAFESFQNYSKFYM